MLYCLGFIIDSLAILVITNIIDIQHNAETKALTSYIRNVSGVTNCPQHARAGVSETALRDDRHLVILDPFMVNCFAFDHKIG